MGSRYLHCTAVAPHAHVDRPIRLQKSASVMQARNQSCQVRDIPPLIYSHQFWTYVKKLKNMYSKAYYRRVPSERPPSFIRPPPPPFFRMERIGIVNAPPLVYPPPLFPSVLLPVISHPTSVLLPVISHPMLPPCIMKCQNVRDISQGTWPTIVSAFMTLTAWSL